MSYFDRSISFCKSVDQPPAMVNSMGSPDFGSKSRHSNTAPRLQIPPCDRSRSRSAVVADVVIFIAVICACGFLLFPYIQILVTQSIQIGGAILYLVKEEFSVAPLIYISIGLSVSSAVLATWLVVSWTGRKCGNPNCKGLRNSVEFDIQLETEDCVKNSPSVDGNGINKGLFELARHQNRELEAQLRKMAPPNGRAVLILRAKCGCSVGRLQVPGPKKNRKIKK
ncbi:60S ribosomal protein L34 [Senna tora]|uniref:60S ribosomal protein L34 n=1 Tax=Senna tora TaxID=362788 RepID=A0A834WF99_9FABA|nr:60S ribosomal protein L34 [Senna tora]